MKSRGKRSLQICGGCNDNAKKRNRKQNQLRNQNKLHCKAKEIDASSSLFPEPPKPPAAAVAVMESTFPSSSSCTVTKAVNKLINACRERDINLVTMPQGMSRRKMNTTRYIEKADTILWRYKWKIHVYIYYFHRVANPIDIYYYQATFCLCTE